MVRAFSRLHLGLFELGGHFGRRFGGTGVYIQRPGLTVAIENSPQKTVVGDHVQLAIEATEAVETYFGRKFTGRMTVSSEIPVHRGFGSVTQLKLAVATAVLATWNIVVEPARLAPILGRGRVSNIGTLLFEHGGFVVELPKKDPTNNQPCFIRFEFPEEWTFVITYPKDVSGPDDETEKKMFENLLPMSVSRCAELSHVLLSRLLPALWEKDVKDFGESLTAFQRMVGEHFSSLQGGVFRSQEAIDLFEDLNAAGVGQSSWGPAVYALFGDERTATDASEKASEQLGDGWVVFTAKAVNHGAVVSISP